MNFPKFWARGEFRGFLAWRWSSQGIVEAQALADTAARELAYRAKTGPRLKHHGAYYPNRPVREQVLEEFYDLAGDKASIITRNSYGCLVLNAARAMFVDIDLDGESRNPATGEIIYEASGGFFANLRRSFGSRVTGEERAIAKVEEWTRQHSDWGWRIYRTFAGLRLLATHALIDSDAGITADVFQSVDADPLYRQLCKTQKCFRARLTPKPWRCGVDKAPERWPFLTPKRENAFNSWKAKYEAAAENYATCKFLQSVGTETIHPDVQSVLTVHDNATRASSKLQLA
jgi:hypothetical protein